MGEKKTITPKSKKKRRTSETNERSCMDRKEKHGGRTVKTIKKRLGQRSRKMGQANLTLKRTGGKKKRFFFKRSRKNAGTGAQTATKQGGEEKTETNS